MVSSTISFIIIFRPCWSIYGVQILCSFLFEVWPSSSFWCCQKLPGAFGCSSASSCQYLSLYLSIPGITPACCSDWSHVSFIGWWGHGNLQSFLPQFVATVTRRSSCLTDLSDPVWALILNSPITFNSFHRSLHGAISTMWDTIPANLLLQDHATGWRSVLKCLQRCCR